MLWIGLAVLLAAIVLWRYRSPAAATDPTPPPKEQARTAEKKATRATGPGEPAKPAKKTNKTEAPAKKPAAAEIAKLSQDDDDVEFTLVTLPPAPGSLGRGPLPSLGDPDPADLDINEEPLSARDSAVPIVYDDEAHIDEPTRPRPLILVSAAAQTDRGMRRKKNEDSYLKLDEQCIYAVADGMGGYAGGEIASRLAVEALERAFRANVFDGDAYPHVPRRGSDLALAIQMANADILAHADKQSELRDMGTTIVAARFSPNKQRLYVGHVGDSRCYRLRGEELRQMTTDHTLAQHGIDGPMGGRLSRAVGIGAALKVDLLIARPMPGDVYLLCSDGLSKMLEDWAVEAVLVAEPDLEVALEQLIAAANAAGGKDNVTAVLVRVKAPDEVSASG
jgi:PPM family protein phosphatase